MRFKRYILSLSLKISPDTYAYISLKWDTSPLSNYVMHPFWNSVVKLFPSWIAPNLLTLCGFLFLVSQTILLAIVDPSFSQGGKESHIASWVSFDHLNIVWILIWLGLTEYALLFYLPASRPRRFKRVKLRLDLSYSNC